MTTSKFVATPCNPTLIVIDARVDAPDILLRSVCPETQVLFVDAQTDAWAAIARRCEEFGPIKTLALFAHGGPNRVDLGAAPLTPEALGERGSDFAQVRASLALDGQVLLYACRVGALDRALIDTLSERLGCAVAASSRLVGAAELGGSWDLDLWSGALPANAGSIWQTNAPANYPAVLTTHIVSTAFEFFDALLDRSTEEIILTADINLTSEVYEAYNEADMASGGPGNLVYADQAFYVRRDLSISSSGAQYRIDGNNEIPGFLQTSNVGGDITIDNVAFSNFDDTVITSEFSVVITDSLFIDNTGNSGAGAIEMSGGYLNIDGTTFEGNQYAEGGGAIRMNRTEMVATDTSFIENEALGGSRRLRGGACRAHGHEFR